MIRVQRNWTITPTGNSGSDLSKIIIQYKDLLNALVRRELTAGYQQTLIGTAWLLFQPLLSALLYFFVFSRIVKVNTNGIPPFLFYMLGSICWSFFSDIFSGSMYAFIHQAHILQKVYFPRVLIPIAQSINHTIRFGLQLVFFLVPLFFWISTEAGHSGTLLLLLVPVCLLQIILLAMGTGMLVSIWMLRYRDLEFLVQFILRLAMFATPILYPLSIVPEHIQYYFWLNPLSAVFETLRVCFFGKGSIPIWPLIISFVITILIFMAGVRVFTHAEKKIIDFI